MHEEKEMIALVLRYRFRPLFSHCIHLSLLFSSLSLSSAFKYLLLYCFYSLLTLQLSQFNQPYLPSNLLLSQLFGLGNLSIRSYLPYFPCGMDLYVSGFLVYNLVYVSCRFCNTTPNQFLLFYYSVLIIC